MSQTIDLDLNSIPYQNVDPITLNQYSDSLYDGYIDELKNTVKRPGIEHFIKLGTAKKSDSLYWWESKSCFICVSDGNIYKIVDETGTKVDLTGDKLEDQGRVTFASNGTYLVMANGEKMVYTDGTALTAYITDPDAPTKVTHVAFLDDWLLAFQVGSQNVQFADFETTPTTWYAADYFVTQSNPDGLISMYVNQRIIYLMGTNTVEFWINDGISPFSRIDNVLERGITAPYSTVNVNDTLYFFDYKRRLTAMNGYTAQIISTSFDKTIQGFSSFNDVLSDYITIDGRNFILFTFPTENRTFLYDLDGPGTPYWAEWSYWDELNETRKRFILNCYAYSPLWNIHVIGSCFDDNIFMFSSNYYDDNGVEIRFSKTTGNIDHQVPDKLKRSYQLKLIMKSGIGIGNQNQNDAFARIRWRDNGSTI